MCPYLNNIYIGGYEMKRIIAILMIVSLFMLCACTAQTQTNETQANNATEQATQEQQVQATATNADGTFAVTLDKYSYDVDKDTITVTLENDSDSVEYSCCEKVILEQFDEATGEYVSLGEDQVYDDLMYLLTAQTDESFSFKLSDKYPDFKPTQTTQCRLGFEVENNTGDVETIYINVELN